MRNTGRMSRVINGLSDEEGAPQAFGEPEALIVEGWFDACFRTTREEATRLTSVFLSE